MKIEMFFARLTLRIQTCSDYIKPQPSIRGRAYDVYVLCAAEHAWLIFPVMWKWNDHLAVLTSSGLDA